MPSPFCSSRVATPGRFLPIVSDRLGSTSAGHEGLQPTQAGHKDSSEELGAIQTTHSNDLLEGGTGYYVEWRLQV